MVKGDAIATANNILANEFLFRTGIASNLISQVIFLLVVLVLYRLFKEVNVHQARLMVGWVIVAVPMAFFASVYKITALMILKGGIFESFEPEQINDLAAIFLKIGSYGTQMVQLYWGLWFIPFGLLVYKSGFIPRILGILLILNGIAYMILSFTFLLFPEYIMPMPNGQEFIAEGEYIEIEEFEKIISSANFKPLTEGVEIQALFQANKNKTDFTFNVVHPTEEYKIQQEKMGIMNGWGSVFDRLGELLQNM